MGTLMVDHQQRKMKFPVSFTLVFLCLSLANTLKSFAQPADIDDIGPVSNPSNLTTLTGTGGVGVIPQGCFGCPKVCPPLLPCNKFRKVKMRCALNPKTGTCRRPGPCFPL